MESVMAGKDRDDESGKYVDTYPTDEFLAAIEENGGAASTVEIAGSVGCHRDTARRRLNELAEEGAIRRQDVGDAALWILPGGSLGE